MNFDPVMLYAAVVVRESTLVLLSFTTSRHLYQEGWDVSSAYLFGDIEIPIVMHQTTNSSGKQGKLGYHCMFQNFSMAPDKLAASGVIS